MLFYLQITSYLPLHSLDGATTDCSSRDLIAVRTTHYTVSLMTIHGLQTFSI